jgi:tRNA threonylcarbamoyl adenosine modification protein YeaZ
MKLLAFDTAFEACSVGVDTGNGRVVLRCEAVGRAHQERLFPMIEAAMAEAGLAVADLDRIAVTVGPGSFTGIRVGVAAARGFALVTKVPAIGVTTLAVHAEAAAEKAPGRCVLAAIPARDGMLYAQSFGRDLTPFGDPWVASADELAGEAHARDALLAGPGADAVARALGGDGDERIVHRDASPDVSALVRVARRAPLSGASPKPLYLRPPDAQPRAGATVARQ